jgi:H+/Cl- antiporter ClcA
VSGEDHGHELERASTTGGLPVAPALAPTLEQAGVGRRPSAIDGRTAWICVLALLAGAAGAVAAAVFQALISLFTNLSVHGRFSIEWASAYDHQLGPAVIAVPILGGLVVGLMARFGSESVRGYGIPETMENVLVDESRIAPRLAWLKPLSGAVAIGTGSPFGAEGPIIATGGALGSLLGQRVSVTADERKTLLAAGSAAGMAAFFGTPVAAVLLAVELLLFELRMRSLLAVALASVLAAALRASWLGEAPFLTVPELPAVEAPAVAVYLMLGAAIGVVAAGITRAVYAVEDVFARLPVHWMWWPAIAGVAVGVIGSLEPRTLGVSYQNLTEMLAGRFALAAVITVCGLKLVSWCIALGSGSTGGTLAPLLTVGAGLGTAFGALFALLMPEAGVGCCRCSPAAAPARWSRRCSGRPAS